MNVLLNLKKINYDSIYYNNPVINTVLSNNSEFIKLFYSNENIVLNGIYFQLNFSFTDISENNNKVIFVYNVSKNIESINEIIDIEKKILSKFSDYNPNYLLKDIFTKGSLRVFGEKKSTNILFLKISGIWKTDREVGVTYKINYVN